MSSTRETKWDEGNPALIATSTKMGWTLQGPLPSGGGTRNKASRQVCVLRTNSHFSGEIFPPLQRVPDLQDPSPQVNSSETISPDDLASKGMSAQSLFMIDMWRHGPEWQAGAEEASPPGNGISRESSDVVRDFSQGTRIHDLQPFLENHGILRFNTRSDNVVASKEAVYPILQPPNHHCRKLIIDSMHRTMPIVISTALLRNCLNSFWLLGRHCVGSVNSKSKCVLVQLLCRCSWGRKLGTLSGAEHIVNCR